MAKTLNAVADNFNMEFDPNFFMEEPSYQGFANSDAFKQWKKRWL